MASVARRRGALVWSAYFRDADGRQHCFSTGTDQKHAAMRIAQEYESASRQKKTLRQIQKTLEAMRELLTGEVTPRATLRQVAEGWLATKRPETSFATMDLYSRSVKKLLNALAQKADLPVGEITRADLVKYRNAMAADGLQARTVNQHLKVARMICKLARRDGLVADDPSEFVDPIKSHATGQAKRPFTLEELRAVLDVADPEWRSMIFFGYYTGQRLGDIARLAWANIDLPGKRVRLTTQKTHKVQIIPMHKALVRHVMSLPVADDLHSPLHPRAFGVLEAQGKTGGLSNQFADLLAQAGLRPPLRHVGKGMGPRQELFPLSFHSLRHTATTRLHEAGQPVAVVKELIGHSSLAVHEGYISCGEEALRKAADVLPEIG